MPSTDTKPPTNPKHGHVLLHLMPVEALAKVNALANRFQREERFRHYVARRLWFIAPAMGMIAVFLFGLVFTALASVVQAYGLAETALGYAGVLVCVMLWLLLSGGCIYFMFAELERRAEKVAPPN
jgi:4-amino-4-deoxy-L-arabinose transferase-like glycosyltransferase